MKTNAFGEPLKLPRQPRLWPYALGAALVTLPLLLFMVAHVDEQLAPLTGYIAAQLDFRHNAESRFADVAGPVEPEPASDPLQAPAP